MTPEDFKKDWTEREFKNHIWERIGQTNELYPNWMLQKFCEHWAVKPGGRNKMKWQLKGWNKSGEFMISMRLASWKTNSMNWDKEKWKEKDKPMKPVKWLPTNESPEAIAESERIKKGYEKRKKEALTKEQRPGNTLLSQHIENMGGRLTKKEDKDLVKDTEEYKKYKEEYLNNKKS